MSSATQDACASSPVTGRSVNAGLPRLLPASGPPMELAAHLHVHGAPPYHGGPRKLIEAIESSGLTGRGGAAFPTHRKLTAVASQQGVPVVVGNGAEGEPASNKDKRLLWSSPHLVLDGLQLAAETVGARQVHLYVHRHPQLLTHLAFALAERAAAGLDRIAVAVVTAPARFLAGEASAVVSRVEGGAALPRFTPPRISERGVRGAPTLVSNVETLAHLALIARYGAEWFRAVGTREEPGSMLTTLRRADGSGGVEEIAIGPPIADLLLTSTRRRLSWSAGTTVPGCRSSRPESSRCATATCAPSVRPSVPGSWPRCRPTAAAWSSPRWSCSTSPSSPPDSAARV